LGVEIVGVGFSTPADNAAWAAAEGFPYELWTDGPERTLAVTYGAAADATQPIPWRVTRLLGADGALLLEYRVDGPISTHPADVLRDCEILFGGE
jgi:peroxiredoxin